MESSKVTTNIPDSIITIILLYFFQFIDEWDTSNASDHALIEGKFLSNKTSEHRFSTFGTRLINKGSHQWTFKIHEYGEKNNHFLYFGIVTQSTWKDGWFGSRSLDHDNNYYSYAFGVSATIDDKGITCDPKWWNSRVRISVLFRLFLCNQLTEHVLAAVAKASSTNCITKCKKNARI